VEHEPAVGREHGGLMPVVRGDANGEVGCQQVVIHDDDVSFGGATPRREYEAPIEVRAFETRAEVRLGGDRIPDVAGRLFDEIGETAIGRPRGPARDGLELGTAAVVEQRLLSRARLFQTGETEIVPPTLEQRESDAALAGREGAGEDGQVF